MIDDDHFFFPAPLCVFPGINNCLAFFVLFCFVLLLFQPKLFPSALNLLHIFRHIRYSVYSSPWRIFYPPSWTPCSGHLEHSWLLPLKLEVLFPVSKVLLFLDSLSIWWSTPSNNFLRRGIWEGIYLRPQLLGLFFLSLWKYVGFLFVPSVLKFYDNGPLL